jgi:hypothetical protein
MSNDSVKKRLFRAREQAAESLRRVGYGIIKTPGGAFDIIAIRGSDARFIRVVWGRADRSDVNLCAKYTTPASCHRELWQTTGGHEFDIVSVSENVSMSH